MKAVVFERYGSPDVFKTRELAKPTPKEGEVLIRVEAVVASRADSAMRSGSPFATRMVTGFPKPKKQVLGTELAGTIEAVGPGVQHLTVGDKIWAASGTDFGGYAEYLCFPEAGAIAKRPESIPADEAAALCESGLTTLPFLREEGKLEAGQKVLINGAAGGLGVTAVQIAKYYGAEVTGVCGPKNVDLVKSLGADHVIDYTKEDFTASGENYDIIFDTVGKSPFSRSKKALAENGIYLTTVLSLGIFVQMFFTSVFSSKKAVIAFAGLRKPEQKISDLEVLTEMIDQGVLKGVVGNRYALEQLPEAHEYIESGHKRGSAIIQIAEKQAA